MPTVTNTPIAPESDGMHNHSSDISQEVAMLITPRQFYKELIFSLCVLTIMCLCGCPHKTYFVDSQERMTAFRTVTWPQAHGLRIEAYYEYYVSPYMAYLEIYGVNVGTSDLRLATKPRISEGHARSGHTFEAESWFVDDYPFSRTLVPALSELHVVTLRSNETALIAFYSVPDPKVLHAPDLTVKYHVPSEWGERFDIWSGTIVAPLIRFPHWPYTEKHSDSAMNYR